MRWREIREAHPDHWLVIEALEAHTDGARRLLDRIAVVERCADGQSAFQRYREMHRAWPERELYFVHTAREELEIQERRWFGIRLGDATRAS